MLTELEAKLLDEFSDDIYGLWEFDWTLNRLRFASNRTERAKILLSLVIRGLIDVYFGNRAMPPDLALPLAEVTIAVQNDLNWAPPNATDEQVIFLTTSDAGLKARA